MISFASIACVASVSVLFRSKERPVLAAREMKREPKNERGGRGRKETLADKPLDFENLRSPAKQGLIGSACRTVLSCVDQRFVSY